MRHTFPRVRCLATIASFKAAGGTSFYGRPLPPQLVSFSSDRGKRIFDEARRDGYLEAYFPLAEQFITQAEPAFCGLGSLAMVLNALRVDPGSVLGPERQVWRGVWRWFEEENLDCIVPIEEARANGINLDQFADTALRNGAFCELIRPTDYSKCTGENATAYTREAGGLAAFREHVMAAAAAQSGAHVVVSFSRATLGQTGDGHFSPVGGYHPETDSVLVLDVARFKYPPYWCPLTLLWEAMHPVDKTTGVPRGYFLLRAGLVCPVWKAWQQDQEACHLLHTTCVTAQTRGQQIEP